MTPRSTAQQRELHGDHISTVPSVEWSADGTSKRSLPPDPDGLCHCDPRPASTPIGECPRCHRLDPDKATLRRTT